MDVIVTVDDTVVQAATGDRIIFRLSEKAGTGYSWHVGPLPAMVTEESSDVAAGTPVIPGGDGTREITLRATGPGSGDVTALLQRPWETAAVQQFSVHVDVH
jgi:predicted secreted protein